MESSLYFSIFFKKLYFVEKINGLIKCKLDWCTPSPWSLVKMGIQGTLEHLNFLLLIFALWRCLPETQLGFLPGSTLEFIQNHTRCFELDIKNLSKLVIVQRLFKYYVRWGLGTGQRGLWGFTGWEWVLQRLPALCLHV